MLRVLVRIRRRKQPLAIGDYLVLAALFFSLIGYSLFTSGLSNQIVFQNLTTGANSSIQGGGEQSARLLSAGLPVLQKALKVCRPGIPSTYVPQLKTQNSKCIYRRTSIFQRCGW